MAEQAFIKIFNMGVSAGWLIMAVILLRFIFKKAPKRVHCFLWATVGLRLVLPFSPESIFSLIPSAETLPHDITVTQNPSLNSGFETVDTVINPIISGAFSPKPSESANPMQIFIGAASYIWIIGIVIMLIYGVFSYVRIYMKVGASVRYRDNIYYCDGIDTPFILGIIRPRIYIPSGMGDKQIGYIAAHENAHIKRGDNVWRPIAFIILSVYWFMPLVWAAYILFCRDTEMACDEKVICNMSNDDKIGYSETLVFCSMHRRAVLACPIAFGEVGVKDRVKSVLNYKKPAAWIITAVMILSAVTAVCFLTDPISDAEPITSLTRKGCAVLEQSDRLITLSFDKALLPDSVYSENGKEFDKNEIIAYDDGMTSIYLKSARFSNEGDDNLYFCFGFDYTVSKKGGSLIYPYRISDEGYGGSLSLASYSLRAENGAYEDSVHIRGLGSGDLIWFYVSTDSLKQAEGKISLDVYLNHIIYVKKNDISKENILDGVSIVSSDGEQIRPYTAVIGGFYKVNGGWTYDDTMMFGEERAVKNIIGNHISEMPFITAVEEYSIKFMGHEYPVRASLYDLSGNYIGEYMLSEIPEGQYIGCFRIYGITVGYSDGMREYYDIGAFYKIVSE